MTVKELREFKRDVMALWKSKPDYTWKDLQEFCEETGHAETLSFLKSEHWISVSVDETKVFIPWNTNRYYENITIKNLEQKLIEEELKDNEEYQKLTEEEIELSAQLSKVKEKLSRIEAAYEYKRDGYISIAEQIKSLKVSDEPDEIDDMNIL